MGRGKICGEGTMIGVLCRDDIMDMMCVGG